jgi:hypothetical protein
MVIIIDAARMLGYSVYTIKEEKRIRDKDKVYRIDMELDQIMTCFKLSFVNLCSLFLTKCMAHEKFELLT